MRCKIATEVKQRFVSVGTYRVQIALELFYYLFKDKSYFFN
jgi:hypothetical protein